MGYSVEQMMQGFVDNRGNNITSVSNKVLCNDGTYDITNGAVAPCINKKGVNLGIPFVPPFMQKPVVKSTDSQQIAQQQAVMQEMGAYNNRLTDKVFGKTEGYGIERTMRLGAYVILGAVVGRYVAKNMGKSTTLGMVVGGLAPLLAFKLTIEYDKKNTPKQEPRQKVGMNPDGSIMTEKQIQNAQISSDISKFIPQNKPKPYMPQVKIMTMAEEREMAIRFYKTFPDEFVLNNVKYFKNSNLEFYKQPFSSEGFSGVMPIKIGGAEFSDAYIKFRDKDLPKSPFSGLFRTDNITLIK
jgi:hypothetical protein